MIIARESIDQVIGDIKPLLDRHYGEIAHYDDIPLDPDYDRYRAMERAGVLRITTAREGGRLVGYAIDMVTPALHYRGSLQAAPDVLFVEPEKRAQVGARLMLRRDEALRQEGVQVAYQRTKAKHSFGPLLETLGYELIDLVYARRLDHGSNRHRRG